MSENILTDYKKAVETAKNHPGKTIRFEGDLPSGNKVIQNITVVAPGEKLDDVIERTEGQIVVGHGSGSGFVVTGTEYFNGQKCERSWAPAGYMKQTFG